jgi:hypothetical protein
LGINQEYRRLDAYSGILLQSSQRTRKNLNSTSRVLAYSVIEALGKNDLVKTTFYLRREEFDQISAMARYLYNIDAIPRPTVGTYSRAAVFKMFGDLNDLLAKEKEEAGLNNPFK